MSANPISDWKREALIRDLRRLEAEIPELIAAIELRDERKTAEALVLLTEGSKGRTEFLMKKLVDMVFEETIKGNSRPLRMLASGEVFGS